MEEVKVETKVDEIEPKTEETKVDEKVHEEKNPESLPKTKVEGEEAKVDVEQLKAELQEATEKVKEFESLNTTVQQLTEEITNKNTIINDYEELVTKIVETKLEQVPADFKDLIPDNLDLKQKLNWLEKAEKKGLFTKEEKKKPNVEIGKPINVEPPKVDTSKLSGTDLLRYAYNSITK